MAAVEVANLSQAEREELLCSYAALILHDEKADVTADNINKLITAAGGSVEPYWPTLFARALKSVKIADLLKNAGSAPSAAPASGAAPAAAGAAPAAAKKEEKEEEEDAGDMDFSLFD
jgi:large subunit ribosomal protein LP1